MLGQGWNLVGEEGPELIHNTGGSAKVFTYSQTKSMAGSGGGGSGGTVYNISPNIGTLVGDDGMDRFVRKLKVMLQEEDIRRGVTA
jgi:hypothetical protein